MRTSTDSITGTVGLGLSTSILDDSLFVGTTIAYLLFVVTDE